MHFETPINIITLAEVTCSPGKTSVIIVWTERTLMMRKIHNTTKWRLRSCPQDARLAYHHSEQRTRIPKTLFSLIQFGTSTCMLMCTQPEPWPLTLAWSVEGWRSAWKCVKEKVIGPLMESIRFRALVLPYWVVPVRSALSAEGELTSL